MRRAKNLESVLKGVWRHASRWVGLPLVYVGVALLALFFVCGWTNNNALLVLPVVLIGIGIVGTVRQAKSDSDY